MFFIPGFLISLLTFPGVIVHEFAHQLFCRLSRVPVFEVCYFRLSNPCGYVIHEKVESPMKNLLICVGPFLINTVIGALILFPASIEVMEFKSYTNPLSLFLAWLGISILMHSFPSSGDAKSLYQSVIKNKSVNILAKIVILPVIGLIYVGAIGSVVWLDFFYAIGVGMFIPSLISNFI
jgi:hypothetical protein